MKKLLALMLSLLLILGAALAENEEEYAGDPLAEENAFLTREEMEDYLQILAGDALAFGADSTETNAETGETTVIYAGGARLIIADEALADTSAVLGATLTAAQEDLRGIHIGDPLSEVLDIYPNDNPDLVGTRYDAALYVNDERPEASVGYLLRENERVSEVTHLVFTWTDAGVVRSGVTYTIAQNTVVGIEIFGLNTIVEEAAALEEISNVVQMQENEEFAAPAESPIAVNTGVFQESDLVFGGMDFLHLTNEAAVALLGETPVDDWMEDSTGEWLRTRQWDDVSIVFLYDSQKNFLKVDSLTVTGDSLEGPRGVRVDDLMDNVMNCFPLESTAPIKNAIALYGDGVTPPYGVLAYGETTATLTYTLLTQQQSTVIWNLTFVDGVLQSYRMLLR